MKSWIICWSETQDLIWQHWNSMVVVHVLNSPAILLIETHECDIKESYSYVSIGYSYSRCLSKSNLVFIFYFWSFRLYWGLKVCLWYIHERVVLVGSKLKFQCNWCKAIHCMKNAYRVTLSRFTPSRGDGMGQLFICGFPVRVLPIFHLIYSFKWKCIYLFVVT